MGNTHPQNFLKIGNIIEKFTFTVTTAKTISVKNERAWV
jgi:hypothetical protein